ncbi:SGNH/GDSL hydrolase family protein [Lactobacillus johnsonii]|uniref:SGNH/GDSL hydrolase family protein n=1 Tax=Lactobacillus johnsonii TaxID=33959 RepID=UPI0022E2E192|nr:SGNH/GDSL hydrolase family protein [Lactobacillus johnsonii]
MDLNIVNNGKPYFFRFDIAKEAGEIARITDYLKTRVNDNGKKVPIQWYDQGQVIDAQGMSPFIEGGVGHYTKNDDGEMLPSSDVVYREWYGTPGDVTDDGIVYYTLEDQFFCKQGMFKGFFGLRDSKGNILTSVNIIFQILGSDLRITKAGEFYLSELENLKTKFKVQTQDVINEARDAYTKQTQASQDANLVAQATLDNIKQSANKLSTTIGQQQDYIDAHNVVTIKDFDNLSDKVTKYVTDNYVQPTAYDSLDALKTAYPNGAKGIFVTIDTGHFYIFENSSWKDCGIFQSAGIADKSILIEKLSDALQGSYYADVTELKIDHINTGYMDGDQSGKIITETEDSELDPVHTDIISVSPGEEYYVTTQSYWNGRAVNFLKDETFVKALPPVKDTKIKYVKVTIPSNINGIVINGTRTFPPRIFKVNSYTQIPDAMNSFTPLIKAQEYNFEQISLTKRGAFGYWDKIWGGFLEKKADPSRAQVTYEPVKVKPFEVYRVSGCSKWDARLWVVVDYKGQVVDYCSTENSDNLTETIVIPKDGAYLEINELMLNTVTKLEKASSIKRILPLSGQNWTAIGDSWTQIHSDKNQSYVDYVGQITGVTTTNAGAGGTGYVAGGANNWNNQFYKHEIPNNSDIYTIFGSFNDAYATNFKFGNKGDTGTDTLWGAMLATINHVYDANPDALIGVITPGPWGAINPFVTNKMSSLGAHDDSGINEMSINEWAEQYVSTLAEFAKAYSLPLLDLYHGSGLRPWNDNFINSYYHGTNDTDTTHPNAKAMQKYIAPRIANFIESFA